VPAPPPPSASPRTPPVQGVSPAAAAATPWTVQAAALRTEPEAARLASELQAKGYPARVERADIPDKGVWFRVRISEFAAAADTRDTVERLRRDGVAAVALPTRTGR
jgi:cell division protein FtsN